MVTLGAPAPVLQATDVARGVDFFRSGIAFDVGYGEGGGFAVLRRDRTTLHLTGACNLITLWQER